MGWHWGIYGSALRCAWSHHWGNTRCRRWSKYHGYWNWDKQTLQEHGWAVWDSNTPTGGTQSAPQPHTAGPGRGRMGEARLKAALAGWGSTLAMAPPRHVWKTFPTATSEKWGALLWAVSRLALSTSSQTCRRNDAEHPGAERGFICKCSSGVREGEVLAHITQLHQKPRQFPQNDTNADGIDWLQQWLSGAALLVGF